MAEQLTLTVHKRATTGKGFNRRSRVEGLVPGIYYDGAGVNIPVAVRDTALDKAFRKLSSTQVFQLEITDDAGSQTKPSLIWKMQRHPYKSQVMHVDFYGVDLTKELKLTVPVEITGESPGVKIGGGVLDVYRDLIEVICLPLNIPEKIIIDVTPIALNQNVHIADLVMPEGVKAVYDENYAVVGVHLPAQEKDEKAGAAEAQA